MPATGSSSSSTARPHRQRPRQLDALLQAVRQRVDRLVADVVDLEEVDHLALDLGAQRHFLLARRAAVGKRREDAGLHRVVAAELDVLEHRQSRGKGRCSGTCAPGPARRARVHRHVRDVLAAERDRPGRRP
jgi:hypothetical protein